MWEGTAWRHQPRGGSTSLACRVCRAPREHSARRVRVTADEQIWGDMGRYGEIRLQRSEAEDSGVRVPSRALVVGSPKMRIPLLGRGDMGRSGEMWGDVGRYSASRARGRLLIETRAVPARSMADVCRPYTREAPTRRQARRVCLSVAEGQAVHDGEAPRARSHQRSAVAEGEASRQRVRSAAAVQPAVSEACSPRRRTRRPMASDVKTTWRVGGGGECASDPALPPRPLLEPLSEPLSNHSRC